MSTIPFHISFSDKNTHLLENDPSSLFNEKNSALSSMDLVDIEEDNFSKYSTNIQKDFIDESNSELDDIDVILISERSNISITENIQNQLNNLNELKFLLKYN